MKSLFFQNKFLKLFLLFHNTKIVYYSYSIHLKLQISHKNLLVNPKRLQKSFFTMNFKFKNTSFFVLLCNTSISLTALSTISFDMGIGDIDYRFFVFHKIILNKFYNALQTTGIYCSCITNYHANIFPGIIIINQLAKFLVNVFRRTTLAS